MEFVMEKKYKYIKVNIPLNTDEQVKAAAAEEKIAALQFEFFNALAYITKDSKSIFIEGNEFAQIVTYETAEIAASNMLEHDESDAELIKNGIIVERVIDGASITTEYNFGDESFGLTVAIDNILVMDE